MNASSRKLRAAVAVAVLAMASAAVHAAPVVWDGGAGTSDWNTAANWNPDQVPGNVSGDSTTIAADGANVTMSAAGVSQHIYISGNGAAAPVLNISRNLTLPSNRNMFVGGNTTAGYNGVVNHTSGTVSGNRIAVASQSAVAAQGTYNFGSATAAGAPSISLGNSLLIGGSAGENGLFSMSGYGAININGNVSNAIALSQSNGVAELRIKGGDLSINTNGGMKLAIGGSGSAKITAILTETGFSTIHLTGASGFVQFDNGSTSNSTLFDLQLDGFAGTVGQKVTIIDAAAAPTGLGRFGNVANGDTITVGSYQFQATYDSIDYDFYLTVTQVPEPISLGGLGVLSSLMLVRRRARA